MNRIFVAFLFAACAREAMPSPAPAPPPAPTPSATTSAPTASASSEAPPWNPPDLGGQPPTRDVLKQACGPIIAVFEQSDLRTPEEARKLLDAMTQNPPPLPAGQFAWCRAQIAASLDASEKLAVTAEAQNNLGQIAKSMMAAYQRESLSGHAVVRKLCPSAKAVPKALPAPGVKYASSAKDWHGDPGWSCLKFSLEEPQTYQYEVKATDKSFVAYARRADGAEIEELSISGTVDDKASEVHVATIVTKRTKR